MLRVVVPLLLLNGCCGTIPGDSCGPSGPPDPDSCGSPVGATVDAIVIGRDDDTFTAYHDGDQPRIVTGGQGASMMGVRMKLTGSAIPNCISQTTRFQDGAGGRSISPLRTYRESDGSYTTKALWIPGEFSSGFSVVVELMNKSGTVRLGTSSDM